MAFFTNLICAVFKSDGISNFVTKADAHFLGHTLGNRHGSNTPWLRATNHAVVGVSILVQVLTNTTVTCHSLCCQIMATTMLIWAPIYKIS